MTRADLDALKWKTANIATGGSFVVPVDKIYEVYVIFSADDSLQNLAGTVIYLTAAANLLAPYTIYVDGGAFAHTSPHSQGMLFSDGEVLITSSTAAFTVRWRDVTEQQLHT